MGKWHSGPPPSVGWWPASMYDTPDAYRWWDGSSWSKAAWDHNTASEAGRRAKIKARPEVQSIIKWQRRPASWPARSKT